jgi:hypothetical protein
MKQPSFSEGVLVALSAGVVSSVAYTALPGLLGLEWTGRALVAGLGLGYVLYLLHRSQERTGRVVSLVVWLSCAGLGWFLIDDPLSYLGLHLAMVWLVRVLYHQPGPLAAMLDLGLNLAALVAGFWAFAHADSIFLGTWTFFLVQALFVAIPSMVSRRARSGVADDRHGDHFQRAYHSAEAALRKLSAHQ